MSEPHDYGRYYAESSKHDTVVTLSVMAVVFFAVCAAAYILL